MIDIGGATLLERAIAAAGQACRIIVVGPVRPIGADVHWCEELPADGGPVAALAAAITSVAEERLLVLAVDLPFVAPACPLLLAALAPEVDATVLVDRDGRQNYLAAAWRRSALEPHLERLGAPGGASMRRLFDAARVVEVRDEDGWSRDCDTPEAVEAARTRAVRGSSPNHTQTTGGNDGG